MAKREKKRKRTIKKMKLKGRPLPLLKIAAGLLPYTIFAVILFLLFKGTQNFLFHSGYFDIKEIKVEGHGSLQTRSSILKELGSKKNTNIFTQDIRECEYAIERLYPELKDIIVCRELPDSLIVSYNVRKPLFQVSSGHYYLVCGDGTIISPPQLSKDPGLIVVSGISIQHRKPFTKDNGIEEQLQRTVEIINDADESYHLSGEHKIAEVYIHDIENPVLLLEDKTRIELGPHRFKNKSDEIKKIINELENRNRKARVIDLRFEDIVVVPR
jgi:cell division septal protein FtsQ